MSYWGNVRPGKPPSGNCPVGELSGWGSVSRGSVNRGIVQLGNCPTIV